MLSRRTGNFAMRTGATIAWAAIVAGLLLMWLSGEAQARRYAAIVVDADSGRTLYARNPDRWVYPASLTKIMTLYMTFDALSEGRLKLGQSLKVSRRAAGQSPSKLGLRAGGRITVEQAILALITKSANDAAVVLAEALGGSESKFAVQMTKRARALGMTRTTFRNASGLPNRRQRSTARDMAKLAMALINHHPVYYQYFATKNFRWGKRTHVNHNHLLSRYAGTDGIKTGYIRASGFNLVASVKRGEDRLIGIVFGGRTSRSRDRHMVKILDKGFARLTAERRQAAKIAAGPPPPPRPAEPARLAALAESIAREVARPAPRLSVPTGPTRDWGIQVGAFGREQAAIAAAERAAGASRTVGAAVLKIDHAAIGKRKLYRARLIGYTEDEARRACDALIERQVPCVVVVPKSAKVDVAFN